MSVLFVTDDSVNVHAAGTKAMMQAVEGLTREDGTRPLLIAVTQLSPGRGNGLSKPIDQTVK